MNFTRMNGGDSKVTAKYSTHGGGGVERERRREVEIEKVPHRCNLKRGRNEAPPGYYILPFLWNIISLPLMRKMAENNPGFRPTAKIYFMLGQSTENK